jgi:molybdopterin-guanine dinucleotide biosynthesis protein A
MIFDAVILAGGRSSRLDGHPKSSLIFEGTTLLQRTLDAVQDARQVVIVGDPGAAAVSPATVVTRESPEFGGPAAAIAAGLDAATGNAPEWVVVLACDIPFVGRALPTVLSHMSGDGVIAGDELGQQQYLLACYRREALQTALSVLGGSAVGVSVRALVAGLATTVVRVPAGSSTDIDTWEDAATLGIAVTGSSTDAGVRYG